MHIKKRGKTAGRGGGGEGIVVVCRRQKWRRRRSSSLSSSLSSENEKPGRDLDLNFEYASLRLSVVSRKVATSAAFKFSCLVYISAGGPGLGFTKPRKCEIALHIPCILQKAKHTGDLMTY